MKHELQKIAVALLGIFAPVHGAVLACLALILLDLATGILAAAKTKQPITSAGLRRSITKLFVYEMAILISFVAQHYLLTDALPLLGIVTSYIGLTELLSVFENLNLLSGQNLLAVLIKKLNSVNNEPK